MFGLLKRALSRNSDPITSDLAAEQVQPHVEHLERSIVKMLRYYLPGGLTTGELSDAMGIARDSLSPRMKPLEGKRLVYRDGTRKVRGSRSKTTVWKAVALQPTLPLEHGVHKGV